MTSKSQCNTHKAHILELTVYDCVQIARVMGNALLNEVLEANMTDTKITPDVSTYVTSKHLVML